MRKWNKQTIISIISTLAVGATVLGVFYFQENSKLKEAQAEIVSLEGNVSTLETELAAAKAEVTKLDGELASAKAKVGTLETDLAAVQGEVATLETDLTAVQGEVATLEAELAAAKAKVGTLETDLKSAQNNLQAQRDTNLELSEDLEKAQDPKHFASLEELEAWLAQDDTDTNIRLASAPPIEMMFILQVRALRDGYLLPAWVEDFDFDFVLDFVGNLAYIGDEIYYVWAPTDEVILFASDVPLIPLHPLSLD